MAAVRIVTVEAFPVVLPFRGTFRIAGGTVGSPAGGRTVVLVKLTADDGSVGWGEGSPIAVWSAETFESVVTAVRHYLAPAVIGRDAADLDGLHRAMNRAIAPAFGTGMPIAKAAIDIAAHDLLGRAQNRPLWQILGYRRAEKVTLSWTVATGDLNEAERLVAEGRERGYRNFNIKLGQSAETDLKLCQLVRRLAPDGFLWGDANGGMAPYSAVSRALSLQAAGLDLLEQPVPANHLSTWQELRSRLSIPLCVDESVCGPTELLELIRLNAISAFALKVTRNGGLFPSRQCAEMAGAAGLMLVSSGLTDAGVGLAANVQLAAAFGVSYPCALNGPQFLADDILATTLCRDGGEVTVPEGPGLGITVDEEKVAHYAAALRI